MIEAFLDSWDLFKETYLAGWFLAIVLSIAGVLAVARDQIFVGAAVAQASTLGIAVGLYMGVELPSIGSEGGAFTLSCLAVGFAMAATLLTAGRRTPGRETHESLTGWVFLLSGSVSILLLAESPHGLNEVSRLLTSSLIGATSSDVTLFAIMALLSTVVVIVFGQRLLLLAMDPTMAEVLGVRTRFWSFATSVWLGLAVGMAIRVSGTLYAFGMLILPALVARNLCRQARSLFWVAPLLALVAGVAGFVVANHEDHPPAQVAVALLAVAVPLSWVVRRVRVRRS